MSDMFLRLHMTVQSMLERDRGQSMTEYALAFSLIALGTVAGQSAVAHSVNHTFIALATTITSAVTPQ